MKKNYKQVSKEEFEEFIKSYPKKLEIDVCGISEPPLISYNDFSLGKFPESIVAKEWAISNDPKDYLYDPNPKFYITEFIDEEK